MHSAAIKSLGDGVSMDELVDSVHRASQPAVVSELASKVTEQFSLLEKYESGMSDLSSKVKVLESTRSDGGRNNLQTLRQQVDELASKVGRMESGGNPGENSIAGGKDLAELRKQIEDDHKALEDAKNHISNLEREMEEKFYRTVSTVADLAQVVGSVKPESTNGTSATHIKLHYWDDSTHEHPREDILVDEGWLEYNRKELGDPDDALSKPLFELTDDAEEADIIVWITVMARHEREIPPVDPVKHAHKVIVLDYADGRIMHKKRKEMLEVQTELAYFRRSYVAHGDFNSYKANITDLYKGRIEGKNIFPNAYSGCKAMMVSPDIPEGQPGYQVKYKKEANVYGKISKTTYDDSISNHGYFQDPRYQNFLVAYKERRWNVVNVLRSWRTGVNEDRTRIIAWTNEYSQKMAGDPRKGEVFIKDLESPPPETEEGGFAAYVGEIDNFCNGHCFGPNYFRHLRDAKVVVTCNPSRWEGDFRLWEAFLSGALVMVDKMYILEWMPHTPIHGKHWITYDPGNKEDFISKLAYYTNPANIDEAEAIAKAGYEFILRHHMAVNRVDYIMNHDMTKSGLMERILDPSKRAILGYPAL